MTAENLRGIMTYLKARVSLGTPTAGGEPTIIFDAPDEAEMLEAGLNSEGVSEIIKSDWWGEMVTDIIETPEMCDKEDSAEEVLEFAKDVVIEYIRKRFSLKLE
jgi:hypothetical protein